MGLLKQFANDRSLTRHRAFRYTGSKPVCRKTWCVTLKPNEGPDPPQGYVDGFKVVRPDSPDTALTL